MTRGYVCIIDSKKKVLDVLYLCSGAYLSYYGNMILEQIHNDTLSDWMTNEKEPDNEEEVKDFELSWIMPTKESRNHKDWCYEEYGYIYNQTSKVLKVYNFGELLYTIKEDEYEKYSYIFNNEYALETILCYDDEKLCYNFKVKINKILTDMELADIKKLVENDSIVRIYLDDGHCMMLGHSESRNVYRKQVTVDGIHRCGAIDFICESFGSKWDVLIQLPYGKFPIANGFTSKNKAVEYIRDLIKKNPEKIIQTAKCFECVNTHISDIKGCMKKDDTNGATMKINALQTELQALWGQQKWFTFKVLTIRRIILYCQKL